MKDSRRSIFRNDAVRRYVESREKSVLPRLVSPRTFIYLWFLLGLLGMSSIVAWFARVPMYASGSAIVVRWKSKKTLLKILLSPLFPTSLSPKVANSPEIVSALRYYGRWRSLSERESPQSLGHCC